MKLELHEINVTLSNDQKTEIRNAFINSAKIRLRLTKDSLRGPDTLLVPTSYLRERDNEDGIDAVVHEQTKKEMEDEMRRELKFYRDKNDEVILEYLEDGKLSNEAVEKIVFGKLSDEIDEQTKKEMQDKMRRELKFYRDKNDEAILENDEAILENLEDETLSNEAVEKIVYEKLSDEALEKIVHEKIWEHYGLFFEPAIDESKEYEGIEFFLDYSLLNDLGKDFVKDNIKNLFY